MRSRESSGNMVPRRECCASKLGHRENVRETGILRCDPRGWLCVLGPLGVRCRRGSQLPKADLRACIIPEESWKGRLGPMSSDRIVKEEEGLALILRKALPGIVTMSLVRRATGAEEAALALP